MTLFRLPVPNVMRFCLVLLMLAIMHTPGALAQQADPSGVVRQIGTRVAPPFAMKAADGTWEGISIDLLAAVAARLGVTYQLQETTLAGMIDNVADGKLDASIAAMTMTPAREEVIDFSYAFFRSSLGVVVAEKRQAGLAAIWDALTSRAFLSVVGVLAGVLFLVGALVWLKSAHPVVLMLAATVLVWTISYQSLYSIWSYHGQLRYGWTPEQVGWSLAAVGVSGALVQGVLSRRLIPRFGQRRIIIFGLISAVAGYSTYAMADVGWMVYLGIAVSCCQGLVFPCLQGLMSAEIGPTEQGELQGAVASIQSLSAIIGPPLMTNTFGWFSGGGAPVYAPGAPFVLSLVFVGFTAVLFFRAHAGRRVVAAG